MGAPAHRLIKSSFAAVADDRTRLLVLGSLPGEMSLSAGEYYAHPRNHFWRLMGAVIGQDLAGAAYPDRLTRLLAAGVGLWDVIGSAERAGSLDTAIRRATANPLPAFLATLPQLRAVAFNGGKAARAGVGLIRPEAGLNLVSLPSSSPAYTLPFEEKLARWMPLSAYLRD